MSDSSDRLNAAVAANTDATNKALAVLIAPPAPATGVDPAVVDAASTQIEANTAALVAATPA